ncbi:MAG: dockerin type I repeat-containing protein [Bacteroidales bacterium]
MITKSVNTAMIVFIIVLSGLWSPLLALDIQWNGSVSDNWHTAANWSSNTFPGGSDNVLIPAGIAVYPGILGLDAECNNLEIESGASLTVTGNLVVNGITRISGMLNTAGLAFIFLYDEIIWDAGSDANLSDNTIFRVYDNWTFMPGSSNYMENGNVYFEGNTDSWVFSHDDNSCFHDCWNNKVPPASLNIDSTSADDLKFTGIFVNQAGAIINIYSHKLFQLNGGFGCDEGILHAYAGGVVIGDDPQVQFHPGNGTFFNELFVDIGDHQWVVGGYYADTVIVKQSFSVVSGQVSVEYVDLTVGLNFIDPNYSLTTNNADIIFNGDFPEQIVHGMNVDKIVVNKPLGGEVIFINDSAFISQYDWIAGGIKAENCVVDINDLLDDGLYGSFTTWQGVINISEYNSSANLFGDITIHSGKIKLIANESPTLWPSGNNCSFSMFDGEFEFLGELINFTHNPGDGFLCNIQGGLILIAGDLVGNNPSFHPDAGTIAFHVSGTSEISCVEGFAFNNLEIAKCETDTVVCLTDIRINGNLAISLGYFMAPDTIKIKGDWTNYSAVVRFIHNNGVIVFHGAEDSYLLSDVGFYDLIVKKSLADTARLIISGNHVLTADGNLIVGEGSLRMGINTGINVHGNTFIAPQAGLISYSSLDNTMIFGGNLSNMNPSAKGFYRGFKAANMVWFNGTADQSILNADDSEMFNNLIINKQSGELLVNRNMMINGNLNLMQGTWRNNQPGLTHYLSGNLTTGVNSFWNGYDNPAILECSGNLPQSISFQGGGSLSGLRIDKQFLEMPAPGQSHKVTLANNLPCPQGMLIINQGHLDLNGKEASFGSGVLLTSTAASIEIDTNAVLKLGPSGLMSDGGKVFLTGAWNMESRITHLGTGYYPFLIEHGFISAFHGVFEYMDSQGIELGSGTDVHPLHSFTYCTFRHGQPGGTLLNLHSQNMIAQHVHFPTNAWGSSYNVSKSSANGIARFICYTGDFSGETHENDPNNTIHWLGDMAVFASADPGMIYAGDSSQLQAFIACGTAPFSVAWTPATGLSSVNITNPKASPPVTTTYTVTVIDDDGHIDTDTVTVHVDSPPGAALSGTLLYFSTATQPLDTVIVILMKDDAIFDTAWTNLQGHYAFSFVPSGTYSIACLSTISWGGVNSADALIILKHYVGMLTLSGMLFEAADVNNSGSLNTIDALMVARRFSGYLDAFPVGNWTYNFPSSLEIGTDDTVLNFRGICYGDVNMSLIVNPAN